MAMKGLNLGSGQRPFRSTDEVEWTNVDAQERWSPDIVARGGEMPMIESGSVDFVVLHQVYEHIPLGEHAVLRECFRVLKPWGSLILTTPDLRALVDAWREGKIDDYIFCVNLYGAWMGDPADLHRWLYTPRTLTKAVQESCLWRVIVPFDWRVISGADIAKDWWIQGLEAIK